MGLFDRIKLLARLDSAQAEEPSPEVGDLIEPGSTVDVSGMSALGSAGGAAGLDQLKELHAAGLIDADTFDLIEKTMTNATAELDRLHASGMMGDEAYAQAMASLSGATSGSGPSIDRGESELLQHGESAPATVLTLPEPTDEASTRLRLPMTLEVHPASGSPYEVDCAVPAAHPAGELKVGDFLQVKVDPADPRHVAIDWTTFGT